MGDLLKDRVAIVTGSGHGIGRAVAIALAEEGAKVITNNRKPGGRVEANITEEKYNELDAEAKKKLDDEIEELSGDAEKTANTIIAAGGEATHCFSDISTFEGAKKLVDAAVDAYGKVDIVVNIAGILAQGSVDQITEEEWDVCWDTKPKGHFNVLHFAVPYMLEQGYGRIVNCASGAFMGDKYFDNSHYCASNAGTVGLVRAVAGELRTSGITANAFCPSGRTRPEIPEDKQALMFEDRPKIPKAVDPSVICPFVVFLCSEASHDITGTVFSTHGNMIARHDEPAVCRTMIKPVEKGLWTVEEIDRAVDNHLLNGYHSIVEGLL